MGFFDDVWDKTKKAVHTVGKVGAPVVYYPTRSLVSGAQGKGFGNPAKDFYDDYTSGPSGLLGSGRDGGGDGGSLLPDFSRGNVNAPGDYTERRLGGGYQQDVGVGMLGASAQQGAQLAGRGREIADYGHDVSRISLDRSVRSRGDQLDALDLQRQAAQGNAPSAAQLLLQSQADDIGRRQMGAASAVRGSGQAAALRNASMMGNQAQLQAAQQGAVLRAQEMAQARDAYQSGATGIRGQDLGSAQIGVGIQGQGLGAQGQGIGLQNQAGQAIGQLGAGRESLYGNLQNNANINQANNMAELEKARMAAAAAMAGGDMALLGGLLGTFGTVAGAYAGGPAGAAAGGAVGNAVGGQVSGSQNGLMAGEDGIQSQSYALTGAGGQPQGTTYEQQMGIAPGAGAAGQGLLDAAGTPTGAGQMTSQGAGPQPKPVQPLSERNRDALVAAEMGQRRAGLGGGLVMRSPYVNPLRRP